MNNEIAAALKEVREALERASRILSEQHSYVLKGERWGGRALDSLTTIESQLADAKPVGFEVYHRQDYGITKLYQYEDVAKNQAQHTGGTMRPLYLHPPTAQLAGPGDEERREASRFSEFGYSHRSLVANLPDKTMDTPRAALETPAVPAGVTVMKLCETIVALNTTLSGSANRFAALNHAWKSDQCVSTICNHSKAIAVAQGPYSGALAL